MIVVELYIMVDWQASTYKAKLKKKKKKEGREWVGAEVGCDLKPSIDLGEPRNSTKWMKLEVKHYSFLK